MNKFKFKIKKQIDQKLKQFIEDYINYIDENNWELVYSKANSEDLAGDLTPRLLDCSIDPLSYLRYIPKNYFSKIEVANLILPENIIQLDEDCFMHGSRMLESIHLSKNFKKINLSIFNYLDDFYPITLYYPHARNSFFLNVEVDGSTWINIIVKTADGNIVLKDKATFEALRRRCLPAYNVYKSSNRFNNSNIMEGKL